MSDEGTTEDALDRLREVDPERHAEIVSEKCTCRQECKAEVHDYDPIEEDSFGTDMYNLGIKQERDRIIKWLRADEQNIEGADPDGNIYYVMVTPRKLADAIEKGEHLE